MNRAQSEKAFLGRQEEDYQKDRSAASAKLATARKPQTEQNVKIQMDNDQREQFRNIKAAQDKVAHDRATESLEKKIASGEDLKITDTEINAQIYRNEIMDKTSREFMQSGLLDEKKEAEYSSKKWQLRDDKVKGETARKYETEREAAVNEIKKTGKDNASPEEIHKQIIQTRAANKQAEDAAYKAQVEARQQRRKEYDANMKAENASIAARKQQSEASREANRQASRKQTLKALNRKAFIPEAFLGSKKEDIVYSDLKSQQKHYHDFLLSKKNNWIPGSYERELKSLQTQTINDPFKKKALDSAVEQLNQEKKENRKEKTSDSCMVQAQRQPVSVVDSLLGRRKQEQQVSRQQQAQAPQAPKGP